MRLYVKITKMKKLTAIIISIFALFCGFAFAQDENSFEGKVVRSVNVSTKRIKPHIVKNKFLLSEGDSFDAENFGLAKQALHNMRIFKELDFRVTENEDSTIDINIDAQDSYYVFPMVFGKGGSKSAIAITLMQANLFRRGEAAAITGAFNSDGYMLSANLGLSQTFFSVGFSNFDYEEKVYSNGSYSSSGLFSADDSNNKFEDSIINRYIVDSKSLRASVSRTFFERTSVSAGLELSDVKYKGAVVPDDKGTHSKIILGVRQSKNFGGAAGSGSGFGAIFGMGLSDVKDFLRDLPKNKYGYLLALNYENGGSYTGSDFSTSQVFLRAAGRVEFKTRHFLTLEAATAHAFETTHFNRIRSGKVLSGNGIYSREFRGESGVGTGASLLFYVLKNKTGVATFTPFVESAVIWDDGNTRSHTGAGAGISYRFWRLPFPIGVRYTYNFTDNSYNVSAIFGR